MNWGSFSSAAHSFIFISTCRTLEKIEPLLALHILPQLYDLAPSLNISWSNVPKSSLLLPLPPLSLPSLLLSHMSSLGRLSKSRCLDPHRQDNFLFSCSLCFVGGFAASDWLFAKLKEDLTPHGLVIGRPDSHVYVLTISQTLVIC